MLVRLTPVIIARRVASPSFPSTTNNYISCTKSVNEGQTHQLAKILDITILGMMAAKAMRMPRANEIMKSASTRTWFSFQFVNCQLIYSVGLMCWVTYGIARVSRRRRWI